jgi:hypothetical protein
MKTGGREERRFLLSFLLVHASWHESIGSRPAAVILAVHAMR